ncbi:MAG: glutamate racemase [Clostridia bacterium]|nr:glutamate racemase [Clostridia bacterium]
MTRNNCAPVGMFDSGVGGISVLREAVKELPQERFLFFGDTLNAPYGTKTREQVQALSRQAVEMLLERGCKAIVIACNTATSAAAAGLRAAYPHLPIIGMEPALKPASLLRRGGVILSLATPGTIAGEKYARLMARYGDGVVSLPCPGLMEFVERLETDSPALEAYLMRQIGPYASDQIDAVVLGCTHYVFLRPVLKRLLPGVPLIDGNEGTVRQLKKRLDETGLRALAGSRGGVEMISSGGREALESMEKLLHA